MNASSSIGHRVAYRGPSKEFRRNLVFSTVLHVVAVSTLLFSMAFVSTQKPDPIQWLNPANFSPVTSLPAPAPAVFEPSPAPAPPAETEPAPRPVPQPPEAKPARLIKPTSLPSPQPATQPRPSQAKPNIAPLPRKPKPTVEVSKKLVSRSSKMSAATLIGSSSPSTEINRKLISRPKTMSAGTSVASSSSSLPTFSADEWRKNVAGKLQTNVGVGSAATSSSEGKVDAYGWYYELVRQTMFRNWHEPALAQPLAAQVVITVSRDGRVLSSKLTLSSGNSIMDKSVLECMKAVQKLDPLPPGLGDNSADIVIDFKLHGGQ